MNYKKSILILSAGRRVELVSIFKEAGKKYDYDIIAADMDSTAPALYFADKFEIIPSINHETYVKSIIEISNKHNVCLIIPTIDTELLALMRNRIEIESSTKSKLLLSDNYFIEICRDKINFQKDMEKHGFKMPKLIDEINRNSKFPIFVKPKSGSSSINAYRVDNYIDYENIINMVSNPIIQECVSGEEYTIDAFLDFNSKIISIVPRLRLATRSGESLKGKIVKDKEVVDEVIKVLNTYKPIGHITLQLLKNDTGIYFIEINPRYGGGAPMSINSGANTPEFLMRLMNGESLKYFEDYYDGDIHLRFDNSIIIRNGKRIKW